MDFEYSPKVKELQGRLTDFMNRHIYPNEERYHHEVDTNRSNGNAWVPTRVIEDLKPVARQAGLWNLFLPFSKRVPEGLTNLDLETGQGLPALTGLMERMPSRSRSTPGPVKSIS